MSYQGEIILEPGEKFHSQGSRKVALCKRGQTAWNSSQSCDYHGPPMRVTVTIGGNIEYDGPFGSSDQWIGTSADLRVENDTDQESAMYVHVE